tara:strand:- start:68 stop:1273 length:1206 start_codon:yes stop_codon:yes gene_type:complete
MKCLFIDYGATNIKSCLYDAVTDGFYDFRTYKCPKNISVYPEYVISIKSLSSITQSILSQGNFDVVFVSTQMHGFSYYDGASVSDYISWRDERGKVFENIKCYKNSGIEPRKGLPLFNIPIISQETIQDRIKILSLPGAILKEIGKFSDICHNTVTCGFGTHTLKTGKVDCDIQKFIGNKVVFPKTTTEIEAVGYFLVDNREVPVFSPVGDLQCAVLGSGIRSDEVCINLGTGSQVSMVSEDCNDKTDNRAFFDGKILNTKTHIPSGRAINSFLAFMETMGYRRDFWNLIKNSTAKDIISSTMDISLQTFGGFTGSIGNLSESNMTCNNLELSIIRCYVEQYRKHLELFEAKSILLSGGVVKNCPVIAEVFRQTYNTPVRVNNTLYEETFLGLKKISRYVM